MTQLDLDITVTDSSQYSDELVDNVIDAVAHIAEFEADDRVTVEPQDHDIDFFGSEYIGVPLEISKAVVSLHSLSTGPVVSIQGDRRDSEDVYDDEQYVAIPADEEHLQGADELLVVGVNYTFTNSDTHRLSQSALITWDEYWTEHCEQPKVNFLTDSSDTYHYVIDVSEAGIDEPCDICGSTWQEVNGRYPPGAASQTTCAVCGDIIQQHF